MKITLCSSAVFFDRLPTIKASLERRGHEVFLPSMQNFHHLEESALAKVQYMLIRDHFEKIEQSQGIYVANYEKNGIKGYIGGNSFLEMGLAFYKQMPIFLARNIPEQSIYREELIALQPIVVGEEWDKLNQIMRNLK